MLAVTESEASQDLARIIEAAQREAVAIRNDRLEALLISKNEYDVLKRTIQWCDLRIVCARAGAEARAAGLTEEVLQELLASDD